MDLVVNNLDIAIHAGELPDSSYRALPVGTMTELFCATQLCLHRNAIPQTPESLCEHRWIATSWQHRSMSIFHRDNSEKSIIDLNRFAKVNTLLCALEMALCHMGIGLLPDVIVRPLFKTGGS
ncbi:MAG: LysR substrate-binding domain-containing protein [Methylovulum sp.]|nr:LysR substrate-binding domain-containing protein [Methylovulum sp.]